MSTIQERLQKCYTRTGLSYRDLAAKTGKSHAIINGAHTGNQKASLALLKALAPIYRTTLEYLHDGNPRVQIFSDFLQTKLYRDVGSPSVNSGRRAAAVLQFLNDRFPGHLQFADVAEILDVSSDVISRVLEGELDPPADLVGAISDLSGVPASWIRLGNLSAWMTISNEKANGVTPAELETLIDLGIRAKAAGIPIESLRMLLDAIGKAKGGG